MNAYMSRIADAYRAGLFPPGEVSHVNVEHREGCTFESGACTCHPRITIAVREEVLVIGTGGAVLERLKTQ